MLLIFSVLYVGFFWGFVCFYLSLYLHDLVHNVARFSGLSII